MSNTLPVHRLSAPTRLGLALGTAVLLVLIVLPWLTRFGPLWGDWPGTLAATVVVGVPAMLLARAARRRDLDPRLRQALALQALSLGVISAGNALRLLAALGVAFPEIPGLGLGSNVAVWALSIAGLLRIPLVPLARRAAWQLATDTALSVGGLALAIFAAWTLPGLEHAPRDFRLQLLAFNAMAAANLIVLNLIVIRGPSLPLRRAIACLIATVVVDTTFLIAMQINAGLQTNDIRLVNSLFFVDYLCFLYAGVFFLADPQPATDLPLLPESVRAFNPLPMAAIIGVSVLLILATRHPSDPALFPLALGIGLMALLMLARVVGATSEALRLARAEAEIHRREQAERLQLMRRLAGGIAHVINNLMTVVRGYADLIVSTAGPDARLRERGQAIGESAHQASALAGRLLLASGHRPRDSVRVALRDAVLAQRESVALMAGPSRVVAWELDDAGGRAVVAEAAVATVVRELVANAVDATPAEGRITVRVRDEQRTEAAAGMVLSPPAGRYSVIEVEDWGRGIAPAELAKVCEPFFTSRPLHEGRGLGLSVVYGVLASSAGGLDIASPAGAGTTVAAYFPLA